MTPDERAERAERVIVETIAQFVSTVEWLQLDVARSGSAIANAFDQAAEMLERNARIAGIVLEAPK